MHVFQYERNTSNPINRYLRLRKQRRQASQERASTVETVVIVKRWRLARYDAIDNGTLKRNGEGT